MCNIFLETQIFLGLLVIFNFGIVPLHIATQFLKEIA